MAGKCRHHIQNPLGTEDNGILCRECEVVTLREEVKRMRKQLYQPQNIEVNLAVLEKATAYAKEHGMHDSKYITLKVYIGNLGNSFSVAALPKNWMDKEERRLFTDITDYSNI